VVVQYITWTSSVHLPNYLWSVAQITPNQTAIHFNKTNIVSHALSPNYLNKNRNNCNTIIHSFIYYFIHSFIHSNEMSNDYPDEDHICGLHRDVRAGTDGYTDVGLRKSRRVIYTVADHRDTTPRLLQSFDLCDLMRGKNFGEYGVDTNLRGQIWIDRSWQKCITA